MNVRIGVVTLLLSFFNAGALMSESVVAPFGSWRSPISAQMLVAKSLRLGDMSLDESDGALYWAESRPEEEGRYAVVRRTADGRIEDVLPAPFSARTLVHEYGGGALLATGGVVYFSNFADQRIWRVRPGDAPAAVTADSGLRYADFVLDAPRKRLIAVCEDHSREGQEWLNTIVAVDLADGNVATLLAGADFYSSPRVSPDGKQLAWVSWDHPNMPWDDTSLFVAPLAADGTLGEARRVAGGREESVMLPAWSPDGSLNFVSDRTNWWNLYTERDGKVAAVLPMEAEFGGPQWVFGTSSFGFEPDGNIVARYTRDGEWRLVTIEPRSGKSRKIDLSYTVINDLAVDKGRAFAMVASPTEPETLVEIELASGKVTTIRRSSPVVADPEYTSLPESIEFPTDGGKTAHAFYYPPKNRAFVGPAGAAPPLLVMIHGGPTAAASAQFRATTQFWTTRGFAVCDVNYGGSTGYGREYRNRLRDGWGVVDVADAANAALFLAKQGKADRAKLIIRGGSAGGYTTLACLTFRDDVFCCGASHYGISDLSLMIHDTHKFESRYLERLVGRYPEDEAIYTARSPIHHLDQFRRPVILLQGLEDKIVPPNQAEVILEALKKNGVPVAYVPFAGEQHGFRRAENIIRAQEAELYFYSRVLGFEPAEAIEPVEIFNLK